jgi:A/G-specific adenine glycosylase
MPTQAPAENRLQKWFTEHLMHWHQNENKRQLPWKEEQDPYKIWLSEIILQQTRAQQGLPYYLAFIARYPTIGHLATAQDEEVFRLWQGLGYYNRCQNMLATARSIAQKYQGIFPNTYDQIVALKGIGPYTAAAIASFAFNLPYAVVDGNVYRVLARFWGIDTPTDSTVGKKQFAQLADRLLDPPNSAQYNQAIMDLGATVCTPKNPACTTCPLHNNCVAYRQNLLELLPVKTAKIVVKNRFFYYILFRHEGKIWVHKRENKDIWQNLYEPYLIENDRALADAELEKQVSKIVPAEAHLHLLHAFKQRLTHQLIAIRIFICDVPVRPLFFKGKGLWADIYQLKNLPFPGVLVSFFEKSFTFNTD